MIERVVESGNTRKSLIWLFGEKYHKVVKYGQSETKVADFNAVCLFTHHKCPTLVCPAHKLLFWIV